MKSILSISPLKLEANAIFIQPTRWCAGQCTGCYVKNHCQTNYNMGSENFFYLIKTCFEDKKLWANQITISLDILPKDENQRYEMVSMLWWIHLAIVMFKDKEEKPEVHLTVKSLSVLKEYCEEILSNQSLSEILQYFDMISFSHIAPDDREELNSLRQYTHINYNYLVNTDIGGHYSSVEVELPYVDSIYLILKKQPVGSEIDIEKERVNIKAYLEFVETLKKDKFSKVIIDTCVEDCLLHKRNPKRGCAANVSKFQIWPDGSVSGCPYKHKAYTNPTLTVEGMIQNLHKARESYDFEKCYIAKIVKEI